MAPTRLKGGSRLEEAKEWLSDYLKDGSKPSGDRGNPQPDTVYGDAILGGIKLPTLRIAANDLNVRKTKEDFSKRWMWTLPIVEDGVSDSTASDTVRQTDLLAPETF